MEIVTNTITIDEIKNMAANLFGDMVKAVVDVERDIIALDAELHSDLEALLLDDGSKQRSLWGINIYPHTAKKDRVEFDSIINLRPQQQNSSRGVDDPKIRKKILALMDKLIKQ